MSPTLPPDVNRITGAGKPFAELPAPPPEDASPTVKMAYKLRTEIGQAIYRLRKCTVEPVIGIIKEVLGFRQFSLRGLAAAAGEWCLVCLAFNLKRLHVLLAGQLEGILGEPAIAKGTVDGLERV